MVNLPISYVFPVHLCLPGGILLFPLGLEVEAVPLFGIVTVNTNEKVHIVALRNLTDIWAPHIGASKVGGRLSDDAISLKYLMVRPPEWLFCI